jgi:hypothetical protein
MKKKYNGRNFVKIQMLREKDRDLQHFFLKKRE